MRKRRRTILISLTVLVLLAGILTGLANYYTEYLWFEHLGFAEVFKTQLFTQIGLGVVAGLVAFVVLGAHLLLIRRFSAPRLDWAIAVGPDQLLQVGKLGDRYGTPVVFLAVVVAASVMGYQASTHWEELLRYFHRSTFSISEPILDRDVGYYLFVVPTLQFAQRWLVHLTGVCVALVAVVYAIRRGGIALRGGRLEMPQVVRAHLLASIACILLVMAWGWRIEMFETLFSRRGVAYGATYTDVHANLIFYRIMIGLCVACAAYLVSLIFTKPQGRKATTRPAIALGALVALYLVGTFVWPTMVQQFSVNPNELDKERPYLKNAIQGTRHAYGLDTIEVKEFPAAEDLTYDDLMENKGTIDNIKIWDHRPLRSTYQQMQVIRLYYNFPSITVDRYRAEGRYWQVMLSARELVIDQLPDRSRTWVNRHLQYTHGYGVCLSPVKRVVGEGLPDLWIKNIPPESRYDHLAIKRPEIYYGQQTTDYVLVKTTTKEFDYPRGKDNEYTTYAGKGGVGIGSAGRRLLFAIRFADVNLVFTDYLKPESRILFYRTLQDRVLAVAPFLMLDREPYMVVADGRLFWIQDAYTTSYRYPYSQPTQAADGRSLNYVRNSVKVVIDAYHGSMQLYIWDEVDPMVKTYAKIFPDLFRSRKEMPASLQPHVRYPKDLFALQAKMYESFHMTDPQVFYNQEDKWTVSGELGEKTRGREQDMAKVAPTAPQQARGGPLGALQRRAKPERSRMDPYYMIMRLPQEKQEEFLVMVPFTPTNKDNMVAWLTARCDGDSYGKLFVYAFPKKKLIFGPMQIEARIDQDEHISEWITLRNQQGSIVIRGDLMVLPIRDSILYVEPIYLESTQTKLPELKRVVVAFGKRLTMKETLPAALRDIFGLTAQQGQALSDVGGGAPASGPAAPAGTGPAPTGPTAAPRGPVVPVAEIQGAAALLEQAVAQYERGQKKIAKGDWAGYGVEQRELKKTLDRLAAVLEGGLKPASQPRR